jgi:hypothetical protein
MGYNCCFFLDFIPLHIESPYNFGGTGPIVGVKNPLQRVNGNYFPLYFSKERAYTSEEYRMFAFLSIDVKRSNRGQYYK